MNRAIVIYHEASMSIIIIIAYRQRHSQFPEVRLIDTDESSGDEIMVVSEKITPKTKMRLQMRQQKRQKMASHPLCPTGSPLGDPGPQGDLFVDLGPL